MLPLSSTGAGYHGRMQQIMQMEKDRHAEFLRQFNIEQGDSKGIIVQIVSRSLEGKLTVCCCLFQEKSNSTIRSDASTDHAMNESRTKRTIIFSPKICDNVDLLVGNIIRIFPPWYASNSFMCSLCLLVARIYVVFLSVALSFSFSDN